MQETGTYLDTVAASTDQAELKTVQDFLDHIENQELYHVLITVDRLTLQIVLMKIQRYSTHEIARYLKITEKAVYRRMDRLKEKVQNDVWIAVFMQLFLVALDKIFFKD